MKKTTFVLAFSLIAFMATAQDPIITSKNGNPVLPEAGDFAIDIDASPFLNYAGRMFTQTNTAPNVFLSTNNPLNLSARYFLSEKKALRVSLLLGHSSNTTYQVVNPQPEELATTTNSSYNYGLGAGYECSRYRQRLRIFYGGEVYTTMGRAVNTTYEHPSDTSANWNTSGGNMLMLGLQGIVGGEYYFAPKIAVGAQLNYGFNYFSRSSMQRTQGTANPVTTNGGFSSFGLDNMPNGNIRFTFIL